MDRRVVSRVLVALLVIGAIVAVGACEYRLGVAVDTRREESARSFR